jgi:hypothetical protein
MGTVVSTKNYLYRKTRWLKKVFFPTYKHKGVNRREKSSDTIMCSVPGTIVQFVRDIHGLLSFAAMKSFLNGLPLILDTSQSSVPILIRKLR